MKKSNGNVTGGSTEKIGKTGNLAGTTSDGGGHKPFMPSPGSYEGRKGGLDSSGDVANTTKGSIPFLPPAKK